MEAEAVSTEPIVLRGAGAVLQSCTDEEVLLEGRAGTGKTVAALYKILWRCQAFPGSQHLLCRETRSSMTDGCLVTLESIIGESHPEVLRCARKQRHSYSLWGSEIVCAGLDEPSKIFSTGWDTIYLNEGTEATLEAWELFGRGARDPKLRRKDGRVRPRHQRMVDCNPGPPAHWLNQRATEAPDSLRRIRSPHDWTALDRYNAGPQSGQMRRLISVHQDNPIFFDVDQWRFSEEGENYLRSLAHMSGHRRARMLEGRWVAADGGVFPEFDADRHQVRAFDIPKSWPCEVGEDPGYDHPTAILLIAIAPPDRNGRCRKYICREFVRRHTTIEEDAAAITGWSRAGFNIRRKFGDPHYMFSGTKHGNGKTIDQQMRALGHKFQPAPAANNPTELAAQVEVIRSMLLRNLADGEPELQVMDSCPAMINAFQSWSYRRSAKGEVIGAVDRYEEKWKDAIDAARMVLVGDPQFVDRRSSVHRR